MATMMLKDCEAIMDDLCGAPKNKLESRAREATIAYIQDYAAKEPGELDNHIECMAGTYYNGYLKALEDSILQEAISRL